MAPEIVEVEDNVEEVSCNGGKTFGHPRIYMTLDRDGSAECYYCGRRFQRKSAAGATRRSGASRAGAPRSDAA